MRRRERAVRGVRLVTSAPSAWVRTDSALTDYRHYVYHTLVVAEPFRRFHPLAIRSADSECRHGRLSDDASAACGCW